MNCREFHNALDAFIDQDLDDVLRASVIEHAKECASCSQELRAAQAIREAMLEMEKELVPPLPAQAAWRNAVQAEAKKRRLGGLYRAVTAIAAAFVLLAGTTAVFREAGVLNFEASVEGGALVASTASQVEYYGARRSYGPTFAMGDAAVVESDGQAGSTPAIAGDGVPVLRSSASPTQSSVSDSGGAEAANSQKRLTLVSATREMYSQSFDATRGAIADLTEEYNASFVGNALKTEGGVRKAVMAIDVPAEDLNAFLEAVDYVGQVTFSDIRSEDISDNYYDAEGRLEALALEKARLLELIPAAKNSEEIEALEAQLEDVYQQIDALEGKIRGFDAQLRYSRVDLTLVEGVPEPTPPLTDAGKGGTGGQVREGFARSMKSLSGFFADMAVSLAVIAPYAGVVLALVAVIWIAVVLLKRHKRG